MWMPGTQGAVRKGNVMALSPAAPLDFVTVMTFVIHSEIVAMTLQKSTAHRKVNIFVTFSGTPLIINDLH